MQYGDILYVALEIVSSVLLFLLADYATKKLSSKWKLCYLAPLILTIIFAALLRVEVSLLGAYIGSPVCLVGFFSEKKTARRICTVTSFLATVVTIIIAFNYAGYRAPNYLKDFERGFERMKNHYILSEYKRIDWDALYAEYKPRFEDVNRRHDALDNCMLWQDFCHDFHDGHVSFSTESTDLLEKSMRKAYGRDYGLSLMTLDNGDTVAVNVAEDMESYVTGGNLTGDKNGCGIRNGTVITSWNGMTIDESKQQCEHQIISFPDKENEEFYSALMVAGLGGEQVDITYIGESGEECTATLAANGDYFDRLKETFETINQGTEAGNLEWSELGADGVCLNLKQMSYDSSSYQSGDHSQMEAELREQINAYKAAGKNKMLIDLRNNGGGSPQFIMTIAKLLAPVGEHTYAYEAVWDNEKKLYPTDENGKYIKGESLSYVGEDLWDGNDIILLVNAQCISAGDHFEMIMNEFDNVKIVGFTKSSSSGQAVQGMALESGSLTYSTVPVLDEDGNIFVDTDDTRLSKMPLDVKIPFDEEAVQVLFDEGGDYVLQEVEKMMFE